MAHIPSPTVLGKVNELLRTEDDLTKLDTFKSSLSKEKSTIDAQLKIEQERRLQDLQLMISNMQLASKNLQDLKYSVGKLDELKNENTSTNNQSNYLVFDDSALVLKNITAVEEVYQNFTSFNVKKSMIQSLMNSELPVEAEYYPETSSGDNLLIIHFELNKLRDFRDQLENMLLRSTEDAQKLVHKVFRTLDSLVNRFNEILSLVVDGFIDIITVENFGLIVKLVKIIQFEEREDLKVRVWNHLLGKKNAGVNNRGQIKDESKIAKQHNGTSNKLKRSKERGYKYKFEESFQNTIKISFEGLLESKDYSKLTQLIEEHYYDILILYKTAIDRCFPPEWNFFDKVLNWYQSSLREILLSILDDDKVSNIMIINILNLEYNNRMKLKEIFKLNKDQLNKVSVISSEKKKTLLDDCLQFNITKTTQWIENAMQPAVKLFEDRSKEPSDNTSERLGIEIAQNTLQIFKSNANALIEIGDAKILIQYLKFFAHDTMKYIQDTWTKYLDKECLKWNSSELTPEEELNVALLPRYITVLANDCLKFTDALEYQFKEFANNLHLSFQDQLMEIMDTATSNSIELGTYCLEKLDELMVKHYSPFMEELFSKSWYKSSSIIDNVFQIIDECYMIPFQEFLNEELFISLFDIIVDDFLLNYVKGLYYRRTIEKKFAECVERDGHKIASEFGKYDADDAMTSKLLILDLLINLMTCNDDIEYVEIWGQSLEEFYDLPIDFLKIVLECKKVNKSKTTFILGECSELSKQVNSTENEKEHSFMKDFHYVSKKK